MNHRFVAMATFLSLLGLSPPASAATFPAVGGSGDAAAVDTCPAGMYLIGLKGRIGAWIDQVQIVCAPVTPAVYGTGFNQNPVSGGTGAKWFGPTRGGAGGGPAESDCKFGAVVTGAEIRLTPGKQVVLAFLPCSFLGGSFPLVPGGNVSTVEFGGPSQGPGYVNLGTNNCPAGEFATGFQIRYGKDVNAMGLICVAPPPPPPAPVAAAPAPAPAVFKQTGALKIPGKVFDSVFEAGIDIPGGDYQNFPIDGNVAGACQGMCAKDAMCKAWTWVDPGVQNAKAMCWLKSSVPAPVANLHATSGVKTTAAPH